MDARNKAKNGAPLAFLTGTVLEFKGEECLEWPYTRGHRGHAVLSQKGEFNTRCVNRIVCEAAHGKPPTPHHQAAHLCGNAPCVNPAHLKWKTPKENTADKFIHGTDQRGEKSTSAKLTPREVKAIRELKGRLSQRELARIFGVHQSNISVIQSGRTWI